ncbi:MBL fold metallo-hydrolase [Ornithobacterium rhinotracheale]|uniref:Zn-dependent hydrolase, glyoxylase n=1 Tax=Ornithobacterium rhinotracheale (strain ATCC 51463 / DSM 15997 / CCUG 23171 / CIP 104009 / LMG 9086) TaxID=867902 RepID=I4A009_ORNRL|nr:MBL fold metallo-hydrolase [Ornithobacterium rhinotracheale]AFL97293.1 Zn-dependent hydrolase, glyoxylase [Ornithobacterium rhinotracheale DSM 15997]AIP99352.1 beta-lactamase [Ornithobacterium rhinotracheale ORT-UMN 88]KGB67166.1 beta-lactamase [Ornithobacterium rhinotracheale H06-030791]MBN3663025.1 MBL fold metallo-hydrolase [Ornithobacterium rhinotracheale]MCK0194184.1 MBL fold metallo-hydrolase [Ornithobacterium rhinotracheale]
MKIYPIECGNLKLDGGAMFGVVPKSIWQKTNPADANNMVDIATRSLLIEHNDRLVLIDCGMGDKQSEKFFSYYYLWGDHSVDASLAQYGFHRDDITDVFFTHLHFDHCGGAIKREGEKLVPAFKNAKFWTNQKHWEWATKPNPREKASFLPENIFPIQESGQLEFFKPKANSYLTETPLGFEVICVDGHTEKQMIPVIHYQGKTIAYAADLIPTAGHVPLVYVPGYDTRPLLTMREKDIFLKKALKDGWFLAFEHDVNNQLATLKETERGIRVDEIFTFNEVFQ